MAEICVKNTQSRSFDKPKDEARIVPAAIMRATTGETRGPRLEPPDARKVAPAAATFVEQAAGAGANREGERVATLFIRNPEIATRCPPLIAVRLYPPAAGPRVREQMSELMPQRAVDLVDAMITQPRIQRHAQPAIIRTTCGGSQPAIPLCHDITRQPVLADASENCARLRLDRELGVAAGVSGGEVEVQLIR